MNLTQEQRNLIEKMGVFQERTGMPPTEARVIALLLVADETELTFEEIRELLHISKSAASNALNMLLKTNKIEYITKSGDRKRYFKTKLQNWENETEANLQGMLSINDLLKEILKQRTKQTPEFNKSLKDVTEFIEFMQKELVNVFKKWKDKN